MNRTRPAKRHHKLAVGSWLWVALAFLQTALPPSAAEAFSDPDFYGEYPSDVVGGGGGRYFTGSPADGYDCSVCHTSTPSYGFPLYQTGLPVDGYVPGETYKIKLSWPEAAQYERQALAGQLHPNSLITAEFVAEDAGSSGTLALAQLGLTQIGLDTCQPVVGGPPPPLQSLIYQLSPGAKPVVITDRNTVCSTSGDEAKRCVLANKQCIPGPGASQLQAIWTAPPQWRGPIWFSAGFVTTAETSGVPNDFDFVSTLSIPMNAISDGPTYQTKLDGGCSVSAPGRAQAGSLWVIALLLASAWLVRKRLAAHGGSLLLALSVAATLAAVGCSETTTIDSRTESVIGRFEPGVLIDSGVDSGPLICQSNDIPSPENDAGPAEPGGSLTLAYTTTKPIGVDKGRFEKDGLAPNYGVVWIEDSMGRFVKTLELYGKNLYVAVNLHDYLQKRVYCSIDVVTQATSYAYEAHTTTWDGKDSKGHVVPDGTYTLYIDVQIDEAHPMEPFRIDFVKGRVPQTITPPPVPPQTGTTLIYTPN